MPMCSDQFIYISSPFAPTRAIFVMIKVDMGSPMNHRVEF